MGLMYNKTPLSSFHHGVFPHTLQVLSLALSSVVRTWVYPADKGRP
jgi:hypothetical protein